MKKFIIYSFIALSGVLFISTGVQSQILSQEPPCETEVFTGTVTYPNGEPSPFDWECQGQFTDCTEVYITCPRDPE